MLATLTLGSVSLAGAQARTGGIAGAVRDRAGTHLGQVTVGMVGSTASALHTTSTDSGTYWLGDLTAGTFRLFARRIGYAPETLTVAVASGATAYADFVLVASAVQLEAEVVRADATRGKMGQFNRRRERGVGAFITRGDIEKRKTGTVSELLRYLPGVGVTQKMAGEPQPVHMQRSVNSTVQGACTVHIYVDGHPYPNGSVDDFAPLMIEGIEVYRSASEIPAEFRTRDATCGVIGLWTRDPEAARQRP